MRHFLTKFQRILLGIDYQICPDLSVQIVIDENIQHSATVFQ